MALLDTAGGGDGRGRIIVADGVYGDERVRTTGADGCGSGRVRCAARFEPRLRAQHHRNVGAGRGANRACWLTPNWPEIRLIGTPAEEGGAAR